MLLNGIPPKEIAYNLHITYNTFLFHQKELYRKLGVHSVHELFTKFAPAAKSDDALMIAPESGVAVQETNLQPSAPAEVQEGLAASRWLDKRRVFFGSVLLAAALLFFIIKLTNKAPVLDEGLPAVFNSWNTFKDKKGSSIEIKATSGDIIDGKSFTSYTISGVLTGAEGWHWAGMTLRPAPLTHQAMKRMSSFSFKVLGDGRSYRVNIPTTDTHLEESDMDHYCIMFPTTNGQISAITITVDDLMQQGHGIQVPFIHNNILSMEFFAEGPILSESAESFYLKVWDIRIY